MKLPRDLSGAELASILRRYEYEVSRQTGSHLRLTSRAKDKVHHITIPRHRFLNIGTLGSIISDIATYLEVDRETLAQELFGR